MFKRISVVGGDLRQLTVARLMAKDGYDVVLFGFEQSEGEICETDIERALDADAVILPLPVSFDGEYLNAPFGGRKYGIGEILEKLNVATVVFGGQMKPGFIQELENRGIKYCDYLNREELAIKNAVPTAFTIWVWILVCFIYGFILSYFGEFCKGLVEGNTFSKPVVFVPNSQGFIKNTDRTLKFCRYYSIGTRSQLSITVV